MNCNLEQSEETVTLTICGTMTIEDAADLKSALAQALAGGMRIEIKLDAADSIDLSCLQVLCSAHRAALHAGKQLMLAGHINTLLPCLEDAGFPRHTGCHGHDGNVCLWHEDTLS